MLSLFLPLNLIAQDYTGTWTGWVEISGTDIPYELVIFEGASGLEGYSMTSVIMDDVKNTGIKTVKFSINKKNKLQLEDDELVFSDFSKPPRRNIMAAELAMEASGPTQELNGSYRSRSVDMRDRTSYTGKIFLKRVRKGEFNELTARLNDMKLFPLKERFVYSEELIAKNAATLKEKDKSGAYEKELSSGKENRKSKQGNNRDNDLASSKNTGGIKENENGATDNSSVASNKEKAKTSAPKDNDIVKNSNKNDKAERKEKQMKEQTEAGSENKSKSGKIQPEPVSYDPNPAADLSTRRIEVIHNYYFTGDSLEITFYDNGTVDGDTISVLLNRNLLIGKKQLSTEPLTEKIRIPANADSLELVMYAENLGTYPPNTGILIIKDGKSRVELRFAGDLSRSASVILRRKK